MRDSLIMLSIPLDRHFVSSISFSDLSCLKVGTVETMLMHLRSCEADSWIHLIAVTEGSISISIPETGNRKVNAEHWCLLSDHDVNSSFSLQEGSQGWVISMPHHLVEAREQPGSLRALDCLSCENRSAPFFVTGLLVPRIEDLLVGLIGEKTSSLSSQLLQIGRSFEIAAWVFDQPVFSRPASCQELIARSEVESVKRVAAYLDSNLEEEHSLNSVCKFCHINEFKLKKAFKTHFGTTVFGYLRSKRMHYAKNLLEKRDYNVMEVANNVGYSNASHFSKAFRAEFGFNPSKIK